MLELRGKYTKATVFTDKVESSAVSQIIELCNQDFTEGSKIRIMPDVHAGAGCVIGFTADLGDKVVPNLIGVDIGCGMLSVNLGPSAIDFDALDTIIRKFVPVGSSVHQYESNIMDKELLTLQCGAYLKNISRIKRSIGSLGAGNHFAEINTSSSRDLHLVIHSGSRNLGKQVADFYQRVAITSCDTKPTWQAKRARIIEELQAQGKVSMIREELDKLRDKDYAAYPPQLCFLTGERRDDYLNDMQVCQNYASKNREFMASIILSHLRGAQLKDFEHFETIHNYINFKDNIIRKGAISAYKDEKVLIPINMRDGSILAVGKGNPDWNFSAPHGAGRLMSRSAAKRNLDLAEFEASMKGIYTTSVGQATLDEAPMSYKPIEDILDNIGDTVEVLDILKPVYNFKAGE